MGSSEPGTWPSVPGNRWAWVCCVHRPRQVSRKRPYPSPTGTPTTTTTEPSHQATSGWVTWDCPKQHLGARRGKSWKACWGALARPLALHPLLFKCIPIPMCLGGLVRGKASIQKGMERSGHGFQDQLPKKPLQSIVVMRTDKGRLL